MPSVLHLLWYLQEEWFKFGLDILDEKVTRYMRYISRIKKVVQSQIDQLTGERQSLFTLLLVQWLVSFIELACLMLSNYVNIFILDFLTRDYPLVFAAFTYLATNLPIHEEMLWR